MCLPETCFWVKKKFQDISIHHTSLAPVVGHCSHSSLIKEKTTDCQAYLGWAICSYNEGVYIAKGDGWPIWLLDFCHDCSTSHDFSTNVTLQLNIFIRWNFTLHYIGLQQVWSIVVMWPRRCITQLNMKLLTCTSRNIKYHQARLRPSKTPRPFSMWGWRHNTPTVIHVNCRFITWFLSLYPQLLQSHIACHISLWSLRDRSA